MEKENINPQITYKGFDKDLKCRGFQYEVGKDYDCAGDISLCKNGFHACENPFEVFSFYPPCSESGPSRYCEVIQSGDKVYDKDKTVSSHIHIKAEIGLAGIINAGVKFILDKVNWKDNQKSNMGYRSAATNTGNCSAATNTGDQSAATNTGDRSAATNTGDQSAATNKGYRSAATNTGDQSAATNKGYRSAATNTGDQSAATNTGDQSAATNTGDQSAATNKGYRSAATNTGDQSAATNNGYCSAATNTGDQSTATNKGYFSAATNTGDQSAAEVKGKESIAVVTGRDSKARGSLGNWLVITERDENWHILGVKAVKVDGETIKPDTWYTLRNDRITEV